MAFHIAYTCGACFLSMAMKELNEEGGIVARSERYKQNHRTLVDGMRALGFKTLLPGCFARPDHHPLSCILLPISISILSTVS